MGRDHEGKRRSQPRQAGLHDGSAHSSRPVRSSGLARTRVTPNALTTAGVSLCLAASVLVFFENRNPWLFYWVGAAGRSSSGRSSTSSTVRSRAPAGRRRRSAHSSTPPPTASARERCSARSRSSFTATIIRSPSRSPLPRVAGSFLVSYTRAGRRRSACAGTWASALAPSASS